MNETTRELIQKIKLRIPGIQESQYKDIVQVMVRGALKEMLILDEKMCDTLIVESKTLYPGPDEAIEAWEKTIWHKTIKNRVNGLRKILIDIHNN